MKGRTIARETLRQTYMIFALLVNILVTMYMIVNDDNTMEAGTQLAHYYRLLFCGIWSICACWYMRDKYIELSLHNTPKPLLWFSVFTLGVCFSLWATHSGNLKPLIANALLFIAPYLALLGSYCVANQYKKQNYIFVLIFVTIIACLYSYFSIYKSYNILGERGHFGVAYYALYLLPIMLACEKRWLRIVCIVIVSVIIVSSVKRGGLIALVLGVMVYLIISRYITNKGFKTAIVLCFILALLCVFFYFMISYLGDNIIERLLDSDDTTGSGRLDIWNSLFERMQTQDLTLWIFGNGHLSTTQYSWENLTAHNDFLEIVYNYGIFNFIVYLFFFISLVVYTLQAIRQKNTYAPSLAMMLTIFTILSMISIIILSHTCVLTMISFGLLLGWNEQETKQLKKL